NHDNLVTATISLSQMAMTVQRLDAMRRAQAEQSPILPCPFFMRNPLNGDSIKDKWAVFLNTPAPDQESEAGAREFTIALPNGRDQIELASALSI
ncbi:MAG: hypothetical protein ABEN55_00590, partial [Bradymonadaceae bacterium]